jgi:outer membrane lipoprotein-sorting protein
MRNKITWIICLSGLLVILVLAAPAQAGQLTARQILDRIDDLYRGDSAKGRMSMSVTTQHWKRTLVMRFWSLGKEHSLVRVLSPKKEQGTATLRVKKNIWNYLPKVKRVIKLPSSMMSASWMGSHFTNDDLVKESRMADDYTYEISFQGERGGREVVELELIPKPEAAVVWGKVLVLVDRKNYHPVKLDYFDEDLALTRTMFFESPKDLGGRKVPTVVRMVPLDKPGEFTLVTYHEAEFNLGLEPDFFSLRTLQR